MSFFIKNLTGLAIDLNDLGIQLPAGVAGEQTVDVGGAQTGGSSTALVGGTTYTASIVVDGGASQPISILGSTAATFTDLINELNADITGATAALTGGNIVITSDSTGATSSIDITAGTLFAAPLSGFVAILAATSGTGTLDLLSENAADVQASGQPGGDLFTEISAGNIIILDPKDGVTQLSLANSLTVAQVHNDPNWGIRGAILGDLDDVNITSGTTGDVLQLDGSGNYINVTAAALAGDMALGDLSNVSDTSGHANTEFFILKGDNAGGFTVEDGSTETILLDHIRDTAGALFSGATQTDITFSYDSGTNTVTASVDDNFLRNTGDTLDSGTLTIAAGSTLAIAAGGFATMQDAPSNSTDLTNKAYVDSIAAGLDQKESVKLATVAPLPTVVAAGTKVGKTLTASATGSLVVDGVTATLADRILVKNEVDPVNNGIYVVTTAGESAAVAEITEIVALADNSSSLNNTYFQFYSGATAYFVWFNVGAAGSIPAGTGTGIEVAIAVDASADTVASAIQAAVDGNINFSASVANSVVTITTAATGVTTDAVDVNTGFGIKVTQQGTAGAVAFVLTRASDADGSPVNEVSKGMYTFVETGTANDNTGWTLLDDPSYIGGDANVDTDPQNYTQFQGLTPITDGIGISKAGTVLDLDVGDLSVATILSTDELAFHDASATPETSGSKTRKTTAANFITDLNIVVDSDITASDGAAIDASLDITLDIAGLSGGTPALASTIAMDVTDGGTNNKSTFQNVFNTLDVPYGISSTGIIVRTGEDTYASRSILVSGAGASDGLNVTNGSGISGDITVGLDINGTPAAASNMAAGDKLIGYDLSNTANRAFTGQEIADGVSAILGGLGSAYTTINGDTGSATASGSTDTLSLIGATNGGIITVATDGSPDSVTFALDISDLAAGVGPLVLTDTFAVNDNGSTLEFSFTDLVEDLDIPNSITADGFVVRTAADTYASRAIEVDGVGATDGLAITNGDGGVANPSIGLDIDGNALAGEELAAGDKIIGYNLSGVANESFTGQEVADGVATMLGFGGLSVSTIGGQEVLTLVDSSRANKILSVGDTSVTWAENAVRDNDWLNIGGAVDALSGYIVPLNATIVKVTAHTSDNNGNTQDIILYINGVSSGSVVQFTGAAGEKSTTDVTTNIDLTAGDKLRLRGATGGKIEDTIVTLWLKWRA